MFLRVCLSICLFSCLDYSRTNEQIFIKNFMWVGPSQRKDFDYILDTKNHEFSEVPFSMYF